MFWKLCLTPYSTKRAVSSPCVTYARQTGSEGGRKVRKRQCQQVGVGLVPPQTTQHINFPCAAVEAYAMQQDFIKITLAVAFRICLCFTFMRRQLQQTAFKFFTTLNGNL